MIAVGIPTYNEAKNISELTHLIDSAAIKMELEIVIINADNNSSDQTAAIFSATKTINKKISIINHEIGKGHNIKAIFDVVNNLDKCDGCILIDGDITSFSEFWLRKFTVAIMNGADFIVPNYSRNFQEGNTTNHFVYPLTFYHTNGNCPRQPIAGDFGFSIKFTKFLVNSADWHNYCYGYGIDVFLTLQALYNNFQVKEIILDKKEHNPSFGKMTAMFVEVASSYYETSRIIFEHKKNSGIFQTLMNSSHSSSLFPPKIPLCPQKILERKEEANHILSKAETISKVGQEIAINPSIWGKVLLDHEKQIGQIDSLILAKSILPYYLLRVVNYLQITSNVEQAEQNLEETIIFLRENNK
ncbi:glycosyltransferase family 2 protein [Lysinibacillus sp. NPDC047702]|uniref:glycosyltransferase family 2 protein n=1 Tax=unclassified Lysinibacillus TaxID=2636778 RepID=UPI003CFE363C